MKIRVINYTAWVEYCEEHNLEMGVCQLTDEQFMEIYNYVGEDWEFNSLKEFENEFNLDGNYAPMPSEHIIRFFPNE